MKNTHIKAGQEVPLELRKEIYKEALGIIEINKNIRNDFGLCYFLLMVLYGVESPYDVYEHPNGEKLNWFETQNMFPELKVFLNWDNYSVRNNKQRINFLKSVI